MAKNINRHFNELTINRENIRLIYLDKTEPMLDLQMKFFEMNSATQFYTDIQVCINVLKSISNEEIFFIISNLSFVDILDITHSLRSILAIFIYDNHQQQIDTDFKIQYPKIIDIYANEDELCRSIEDKIDLIEKQIFIYHLFDSQRQYLTKESASFLWYQMLINILKQIPQNEFRREEILHKFSHYYRRNRDELDKIEIFRLNYTSEQAIQWLIKDSFLYKLLNHALRTQDIEFLSSFRLCIIDLHTSIEKEYANLHKQESIIIYRKQLIFKDEITKLKDNIGCFISIDGFLLASRDKIKALSIFQQSLTTKENVLLEIHIDSSSNVVTFVDISLLNSSSDQLEILLNMNSLFKIESIEYDIINNHWHMKFITSLDGRQHVNEYLKMLQKELDYPNSMIYFGHLLWNDLNQIAQAKAYFQILSKSLPSDHMDIPDIYVELGNTYDQMGEYNLALNKYQYALNFRQKHLPNDYIHIACLLNHIGTVYKHMNNLDRAIDFYGQALYIYETKCSKIKHQLQRADTISNLALSYKDKNDFETALSYLTLAYDIRVDNLSKDHPILANSLNHLGSIYHDKNDLNQALNYFRQALTIQEIAYPYDHLHKAITFRYIGLIYRDKLEWQNALNSFNHTLQIRQNLLSNLNHIDIAICYGDIGDIYEKMNQLDLALENYQQQFDMEELCLPFNHPNLMIHFDLIINILKKVDQSNKAIELCEKKLSYLKTILGNDYENHPRVARILVSIATMYEDENPKQADQHYQHALTILESKKNEEILQTCLSPMTNFYWKCRMFDRALICQMKLLNLRRSTLSSNHNEIAYTLRGLARLYRAMNKPNDALHYFHQSLNILQANCGQEHTDVKNIQQEIFDLKDMVHTTSANANENHSDQQVSDRLKEVPTNLKASLSLPIMEKQISPGKSISKSTVCVLL
ncbi:hypothetical protein I4U23_019799 [Adineta vaga]|nr:hypothetical protein I4U23_019799 [Adineta vaga]